MAKKRSSESHSAKETSATPLAESIVSESGNEDFIIVGVGASAGGLEAFSQLLRGLPERPGLAIVFVQHMAPQHDSALASLLASSTSLPVVQINEDTQVEVDHVYVIPPNHGLTLDGRRLVLHPRPTDRSQHTPINTFLQSLAQSQGARAVGVILSGTGSDGVEGIHAIKAVGGTTLVQDPETAKQDGMPRAAQATGKIDLVLAPEEIGAELGRLAQQQGTKSVIPRRPGDELTLLPGHYERIFRLLQANTGVDFAQYKLPTVQRRIQRRIALHKMLSVEHYLKYLDENPVEIDKLYQDILIHVTRFFREPEAFEVLAQEILPCILEARQGDAPVRIWAPACSTGEEPYSIAMTLTECLDRRKETVPVQIFATDISENAIEQARSGLFPPSAVAELSSERLQRFFSKTDGHYRINKPIRDMCVFARQDLTRDPPFSKLDLIVCRNVLIYLSQPVQSRLISVFHYALKSTGYLVLGSAETIGQQSELFASTDKKHRIYRKKIAELPADMRFSTPFARQAAGRGSRAGEEFQGPANVQAEANRLILDRYAPPGVIVNEDLRIVQFRGQTGKFLEPAPGDASLNLLKMCREGLLHGLRTAFQTAKKKDGAVRRDGLRVKTNGDFIDAGVEVVPLAPAGEGRHYLVLFHSGAGSASSAPPAPELGIHQPIDKTATGKRAAGKTAARERAQEIERLQKELLASREYLQSIIQDLEAANEELQSANEEILSSNEELQSTNEELDTAKEELQSTNEELNTLNEELHGRNEELGRTNSDLVNLLNSVQIAIVILSSDLRIRRFTPVAQRMLNLIPGDVGRPLGQIKPNIEVPDLEGMILTVIDSMLPQTRDVQDAEGRNYSLTVRPYKSLDNRIDGAVLVLFDIDDVRRHEQEAQEAREYAEAVFDTVREPMAVLDGELRVKTTNPAFCDLFQTTKSKLEGKLLQELDHQQWNDGRLRELLANVLTKNIAFTDYAIEQPATGGQTIRLRLNARRIARSNRRAALILLALQVEGGE